MNAVDAGQAMPALRDREVLHELVLMHAAVLRRMPWVQSLLAIGISALVYGKASNTILIGWFVLTVGVECFRAFYAAGLLRAPSQIDAQREHLRLTLLAGLSGATDGLVGVLFFESLSLLDQTVLGVVLFTIPACGVAVSMSSRYIIVTFAIMVLAPASWAWIMLHPSHVVPISLLSSLYCVLLIIVAIENERVLRRSVVIRFERDRIVRELERSNAEARSAMLHAEQSAQARARVLAAASHDLRQPLQALSIYSAVLAEKPTAETLREVGQNIHQIVRSLGSLLTGLLDLSKLSVGHYVPDTHEFALDRLIDELCAEFKAPARERGLAFGQHLSPIWLRSDSNAIARIARNLIENALKYTERGEVTVTLCERDGAAVLHIADTGKGIPAEEQTRVFEEFYQIDNPGRDRSRGVGLGLTIVQRLCDLNGFSIALTSESGRGTCFEVALGPVIAAPALIETARSPTDTAAFSGARIYVIDDEGAILDSMATLLGAWGAQVATAADASSALAIFERDGAPDLLITDLRLGRDEHGASLAARLQRSYGQFPVLIITGETSSQALRMANETGFALLQKPIAREQLRQAIDEAMASWSDRTVVNHLITTNPNCRSPIVAGSKS